MMKKCQYMIWNNFHRQFTSCLQTCSQGKKVRSENVKPVNLMSPFVRWRLMFSTTEGSALQMFVLVPQSLWPLLFDQEDDRHFCVVDLAHSERCGWKLEMSEMFEPFARVNSKCFLWPGNERLEITNRRVASQDLSFWKLLPASKQY